MQGEMATAQPLCIVFAALSRDTFTFAFLQWSCCERSRRQPALNRSYRALALPGSTKCLRSSRSATAGGTAAAGGISRSLNRASVSRSRSSAPKKAPVRAHHSSSDRALHDHTTCNQRMLI